LFHFDEESLLSNVKGLGRPQQSINNDRLLRFTVDKVGVHLLWRDSRDIKGGAA
jgi:hypothetical protein